MNTTCYPRLEETVARAVLPNGLQLTVVPRKGFSKKLAYLVTDYGSIHRQYSLEGREYTAPQGVAHYLEHKLFDMPQGDVTEAFAELGANVNAFTGYDMTAYYFDCTQHFYQNLELLLRFVTTPYFTPQSVEKERGIIGQEILMTADNPDTVLFERLMEAMYPCHPIREPILGTERTVAEITPQVLEQCHRAFYNPANMMLCVIGDVEPEEVERVARQVLGDSAAPVGQKRCDWEESMTCHTHCTETVMEVAMPMFQLAFKCEPTGKGPGAVRQEIVGELAAEALLGESSLLYLRLYEQGIIDGSFGGGFETVEGMAMLTASGDSDDPQAVRAAVLEEAARLLAEGIPEAEFLRMKRSALGRRIRELDSFDSTCFRLCAYHFSDFDYMELPGIYQQIRWEELRELIARVVTPQRCCMSVIWPPEDTEGGIQDESQ